MRHLAGSAGRLSAVLGVCLVGVAVGSPAAAAPVGHLTPLGCIDDSDPTVAPDPCQASLPALDSPRPPEIRPDGGAVYVPVPGDDAVVHFDVGQFGGLRYRGCIQGPEHDGCARTFEPLVRPQAVAASPKGDRFVYTAGSTYGSSDGAFVWFQRDSADVLQPKGCVTWDSTCGEGAEHLSRPTDVELSPDGRSVYVAARGSYSIAHYRRDVDTGAVRFKSCVSQFPMEPCTEVEGVSAAMALKMSPDGTSLYAASSYDSLVTFAVDPTTGDLRWRDCIGNDGSYYDCPAGPWGIDRIRDVAISPDGSSLYVAGAAVVHFARDPATGALTFVDCVDDNPDPNCGQSVPQIYGVEGVAVSPDGRSVYAASGGNSSIVTFARDLGSGRLVQAGGCIEDSGGGDWGCPRTTSGLDGVNGLEVTPDGENLYATSSYDSAIVLFRREPLSSPPPDVDPPQTTILSGPAGRTRNRSPRFRFTSDEARSTFRCRLDRRPYRRCASPKKYRGLKHGRHVFKVRAIDRAGNGDRSPAERRFKIVRHR